MLVVFLLRLLEEDDHAISVTSYFPVILLKPKKSVAKFSSRLSRAPLSLEYTHKNIWYPTTVLQ